MCSLAEVRRRGPQQFLKHLLLCQKTWICSCLQPLTTFFLSLARAVTEVYHTSKTGSTAALHNALRSPLVSKLSCINMRSEAYPLARARRAVVKLIDGLHVQLRVALWVNRRAPLLGQQLAQVRGAGRLKVPLLKPAPGAPALSSRTMTSCSAGSGRMAHQSAVRVVSSTRRRMPWSRADCST